MIKVEFTEDFHLLVRIISAFSNLSRMIRNDWLKLVNDTETLQKLSFFEMIICPVYCLWKCAIFFNTLTTRFVCCLFTC